MGAQPATTEALRRTPLFEAARSAGGRMVPFAGWEMAVQFSGLLQEHKAVREHCGLFDISHMGVLRLSGAGAKDALQGLVPTDLFRIGPGEACYTVLLNEHGGIRDDLIVYDWGWDDKSQAHELWLVINAACAEADTTWIKSQLDDVGIHVSDQKSDGVLLALQGPEASNHLEEMSGTSLVGLPRFGHRRLELNGIGEVFIARTGYTGEDGFEILLERSEGIKFWQQSMARGISPCGLGARDTLRLEAGMHLYGRDMDSQTTPLDVGLGWLVNLEMPKYFVGREALEQQVLMGTMKRLVGIKVEGRAIPRMGCNLFKEESSSDEEPVGQVTSGSWSPSLSAGIALALVERDRVSIAKSIFVEIRGKRYKAEICRRPFYERNR